MIAKIKRSPLPRESNPPEYVHVNMDQIYSYEHILSDRGDDYIIISTQTGTRIFVDTDSFQHALQLQQSNAKSTRESSTRESSTRESSMNERSMYERPIYEARPVACCRCSEADSREDEWSEEERRKSWDEMCRNNPGCFDSFGF